MQAFVKAVSASPSIVADMTKSSRDDIDTDARKVITMVLVVVVSTMIHSGGDPSLRYFMGDDFM